FKSQFKSIIWKKEPVIKIMGIPFNIKEKVENKLNEKLPDISQQLDQELKHKINLKKAINRIWDRMQYNKPLKRGEKEGFVTKIQPHKLAVYVDKTSGDSLRLNMHVS